MDKEKQIEEMTKYTCYPCEIRVGDGVCADRKNYRTCSLSLTTAVNLYNAGYRKQSENLVEVVRCYDCKYCEVVIDSIIDEPKYFCTRIDRFPCVHLKDYCSYGERRNKDA